jgi:hypothetical protein
MSTNGIDQPIRNRALLLAVVVLAGLTPGGSADETAGARREVQSLYAQRTSPWQDLRDRPIDPDRAGTAQHGMAERRSLAVELVDLPAAFTPGQIGKVRVRVSKADAIQRLLSALPQSRQVWIDLRLADATGREVGVDTRALPIGRAVTEFSFAVPADAVGPITVRADLNERSSPNRLVNFVLGPSEPRAEITRIASATDRVPLSQLQPTAGEQMQRLLLVLTLGRSR